MNVLKPIALTLYLIFYSYGMAFAQVDSSVIKQRTQFIKHSAAIIKDSLHLKPASEFYTLVEENKSPYVYVYVSYHDSIARPYPGRFFYYDNNIEKGKLKCDSFSKLGYDAMLYLTAGTSASMIHQKMFSYDDVSNGFIMLHEAMHLHLVFTGYRVTYDYEESIGDVVANAYIKYLFPASQRCKVKRFVRVNERVYRNINKCINGKISKEKCEKRIYRITERKGTSFQKERYQYKVNNAYLIRFIDYTNHYFELKKQFKKGKTIQQSLKNCFGEPYRRIKK